MRGEGALDGEWLKWHGWVSMERIIGGSNYKYIMKGQMC